MPGLLTRSAAAQFGNATSPVGSAPAGGIWSKHRDSITFDQLQKFWNELPLQNRQELLRLDKQTVFEQARKNLYCSRCNGLLLEGFSQIVMYGKALQQDGSDLNLSDRLGSRQSQSNNNSDELQDPSIHPWGGLTTTKDGFLTLLDCFICSESLTSLQNVFDSARAREHERELLYPDACGGEGRGWISQGMANYGRGHGMRETCALHTARLSCDTLVDFWSALGEETRSSLLRMKEEDFIERLMYRFDSKRFCRDCRRNVIREFKELKELKRLRREPRCNSWFCVADPAFNYEVSEDTVQADWHQSFTDTVGMYHHFEWAIGTGEGKNDILDFEDVGLLGKAQATGLDLSGLSSCFITLRAWKLDGRCTELCVKAHTFKGHQCVHRRLIIGDGFVTITKGESIRKFFEHAEEAEEEEDDDGVDKDGNELDSDGSRPQKHAKSPELAREFLLDAASVIFKEQVEKAFREGTTRQNAHSIFVCLTLKLLEDRLHVACKEIITLAKQSKLLEEEEKEKREEEERKERRRMKEREKKLRRKERLKGKGRERERKLIESKSLEDAFPTSLNESPASTPDESPETPDSGDTISEPGDTYNPEAIDDYSSSQNTNLKAENFEQQFNTDGHGSFTTEHAKSLRRKLRFRKVDQVYNWYDKNRASVNSENCYQQDETGVSPHTATSRGINGVQKLSRERFTKSSARSCCARFSEKLHCSNARVRDRYDLQSCSCSQQVDYRVKDGYHTSTMRSGRDVKIGSTTEFAVDMPRPFYRTIKQNNGSYLPDNFVLPKAKYSAGTSCKEVQIKQIWEPLDVRKRCSGSNSHPSITSVVAGRDEESALDKCESGSQQPSNLLESVGGLCLSEHSVNSDKVDSLTSSEVHEVCEDSQKSGVGTVALSDCYSKNNSNEEVDCHAMINGCDPVGFSSSDNCSSCLSEGDSSVSSSSAQNVESSTTSDSEDTSQHSDCRGTSVCNDNSFHKFDESPDEICKTNASGAFTGAATGFPADNSVETNVSGDHSSKLSHDSDNGQFGFAGPQQHVFTMQSMHVPVFPPQNMEYYSQSSTSWPTSSCNGYFQFPHIGHYVFPSPLGYGPVGNQTSDFSMHYNSLHPMTSPADANKHPLHHLANRVKVSATKEKLTSSVPQQINCVAPIGSQRFSEGPSRQPTSNASCIGQNGFLGNACDESPFSLFHFGGPMAGAAAGFSANSRSSEVKMTGGVVSKLNPPTQTCSKEELKVEEYSLFSGGNGVRFSFF